MESEKFLYVILSATRKYHYIWKSHWWYF